MRHQSGTPEGPLAGPLTKLARARDLIENAVLTLEDPQFKSNERQQVIQILHNADAELRALLAMLSQTKSQSA